MNVAPLASLAPPRSLVRGLGVVRFWITKGSRLVRVNRGYNPFQLTWNIVSKRRKRQAADHTGVVSVVTVEPWREDIHNKGNHLNKGHFPRSQMLTVLL